MVADRHQYFSTTKRGHLPTHCNNISNQRYMLMLNTAAFTNYASIQRAIKKLTDSQLSLPQGKNLLKNL